MDDREGQASFRAAGRLPNDGSHGRDQLLPQLLALLPTSHRFAARNAVASSFVDTMAFSSSVFIAERVGGLEPLVQLFDLLSGIHGAQCLKSHRHYQQTTTRLRFTTTGKPGAESDGTR